MASSAGHEVIDKNRDITWEEIERHTTRTDKWIVIDRTVYDISRWCKKHPGGLPVISHYAGQDATEAFLAFHNDHDAVRKYLPTLKVGHLAKDETLKGLEIKEDFEKLRKTAFKMGLFKPSIWFFITNMGHLLLLEALAYFSMYFFGTGWLPYMFSVVCFVSLQAQCGWTQHDYGHLSVFNSSKINHWFHLFVMSYLKGASSAWWNNLHYQHHAKPNVIGKDPDVRVEAVFVVGETMPKRMAKENKSFMPYNWQHRYFFIIGPPLLFPIYFQIMIFKYPIHKRRWMDVLVMCIFYAKLLFLYSGLGLGLWGAIKFYFLVRVLESHWFVWVTQSNHIPMAIEDDDAKPWFPLQLAASCNIEGSLFNDWFTGHLNFQVEHHLFPMMPRHNLHRITPLVKSFAEKHGVKYQCKTLPVAFGDIIRSLEHSGQLWEAYYNAYHLS